MKLYQIQREYNEETQPWHKTEWQDILRGAITHKMISIAEEITGQKDTAKKAILKATERFWTLKKEVWKNHCDITIQWEKKNKITKKIKKQKDQQNNSPLNIEEKYLKKTFK